MNILGEMFPPADGMSRRDALHALMRFTRGVRAGAVKADSPRIAKVVKRLVALGVTVGPAILAARAAGVPA